MIMIMIMMMVILISLIMMLFDNCDAKPGETKIPLQLCFTRGGIGEISLRGWAQWFDHDEKLWSGAPVRVRSTFYLYIMKQGMNWGKAAPKCEARFDSPFPCIRKIRVQNICGLIADEKLVFAVLPHMLLQITYCVWGIFTLVACVGLFFNGYFQIHTVDMTT